MRGRQSPKWSLGAGSGACPSGLPDLWGVDVLTRERGTSLCFLQASLPKSRWLCLCPRTSGRLSPSAQEPRLRLPVLVPEG